MGSRAEPGNQKENKSRKAELCGGGFPGRAREPERRWRYFAFTVSLKVVVASGMSFAFADTLAT